MPVNRPHCIYPPTDYSVTLPEAVDFHRTHNPYETAYVFSEDGALKPTNISFLEFGRATDRVAHHLRPGRSGIDREVVAIVALSDTLLYQAITVGITRAGYIAYPMSPRNTAGAIIKLLKDTFCHRLLATQHTLSNLINQVKKEFASTSPSYNLTIDEVPSLSEIFPKLGQEKLEDAFTEYPAGARPGLDKVLMYLHSSGSTGFPKTIPQTFRSMVHWAGLPPVTDNITYRVPLIMAGHALPAFHTLGIIVQLLVCLYAMTPVALYPPITSTPASTPMLPSPDNILEHLRRTNSNCLMIIPALLQIWAQDSKAVELLASLEFVAYSGGGVPAKLGNFMADAGVYITPVYGATEFGAVSKFFRREEDRQDWEWIWFSEDVSIHWSSQGDGTREIQFLTSERHQVSIENLPSIRGYATADLWVQHPTKPYFWKIVGRKDDVIVHSSGEKTVPAPMEDILLSHPQIIGAIMFGHGRDRAGVLVELKPAHAVDIADPAALAAARDALWPVVAEANSAAPAFSRIFKETILIAGRGKPLPRAGKGTVMRKAALATYAREIDEIYESVQMPVKVEAFGPPRSWGVADVTTWLTAQVADMHSGRVFDASSDLFDQGMDSLSATILLRRIVGTFQSKNATSLKCATQTIVYKNPSISKLAVFLAGIVADPKDTAKQSNKIDAIEDMVKKYSAGLSIPLAGSEIPAPTTDETVVLLTGSTGGLGAQILELLLKDTRVKKVYALNRPSSGGKPVEVRQKERFADRGLETLVLKTDRLVFLEGDMTQEKLGLGDRAYDEVRRSVTTVIHSAWRVDFNLALASFEGNVRGTRNLINLAREARHAHALRFLFASSISSAFSWEKTRGPCPEALLEDPKHAVGMGYGESKYVVGRILAQSGLNATCLRIGQICGGARHGAWATSDWVPALVKSSIALNALPSAAGVASWLPMDTVAQTVLDAAWSRTPPAVMNVVHPRPVAWNTLFAAVNDVILAEGLVTEKLPFVDFRMWVTRLEEAAADATPETLENIPAIKLLDFFRSAADGNANPTDGAEAGGLPTLAMSEAQEVSETLRLLSSIGEEDVRRWVGYWRTCGFIRPRC